MALFDNLKTDQAINPETDRLGGFTPLETGLYKLVIILAFITKAASEAMCLNIHFETEDKKLLRSQFWMTSGKKKGCKNFYLNPKTKEKHYLPGFNMANAISLMTIGKEIGTIETEVKSINLYNSDQQKEVPTDVEMILPLIGKTICGGVIKQIVDKNVKDTKTGEYVPTGETRVENEIDKFFHDPSGLTMTEATAKLKDPVFKGKWLEKWEGQTRDNSTDTKGAPKAGAPGTAPAVGDAAPQEVLFT